jgi:hypothetical protein
MQTNLSIKRYFFKKITKNKLHKKKMDGHENGFLKRPMNKVQWHVLQQMLRMKGFNSNWCQWVENFVCHGNVRIKFNNDIGHYFQTKKG